MTNTLESYRPNLVIEYHMRTDLPVLRSPNTIDIIKDIEKNTIPKNTEEALGLWGSLLASKMQYDVINYALIKEFPSDAQQ